MLTFHDGVPVASSKGIRLVIEDMRKTKRSKSLVLDMYLFAHPFTRNGRTACSVCAGGSAVIHGLGGKRDEEMWTAEEWRVANFFNEIRVGDFESVHGATGVCLPVQVTSAWSSGMLDHDHPDFFPAWERFADAWEKWEREVAL